MRDTHTPLCHWCNSTHFEFLLSPPIRQCVRGWSLQPPTATLLSGPHSLEPLMETLIAVSTTVTILLPHPPWLPALLPCLVLQQHRRCHVGSPPFFLSLVERHLHGLTCVTFKKTSSSPRHLFPEAQKVATHTDMHPLG